MTASDDVVAEAGGSRSARARAIDSRARALDPRACAVDPRAGAIKICGVTTAADARRCAELGADLVGLNFHPPSPRCLSEERARVLREVIGDRALVVGVFVDHGVEEALAIAGRVGLDLLQFHGVQDLDELAPVAERSIVVLRADDERRCERLVAGGFWGALFDAPTARGARGEVLFGGTGRAWEYERIRPIADAGRDATRLLVAGGIGAGNAARALSIPGVWGIDVCSGVESSPGLKDHHELEQLFAVVRCKRAAAPDVLGG
ncbi:MAG TPA: phosphoribosylanthranilate isomerase [Thermoanaerobaculia bacterium]|nr:phosphoribosylanthranilate isomerase [Thermoanaerobaculia bacterium]